MVDNGADVNSFFIIVLSIFDELNNNGTTVYLVLKTIVDTVLPLVLVLCLMCTILLVLFLVLAKDTGLSLKGGS